MDLTGTMRRRLDQSLSLQLIPSSGFVWYAASIHCTACLVQGKHALLLSPHLPNEVHGVHLQNSACCRSVVGRCIHLYFDLSVHPYLGSVDWNGQMWRIHPLHSIDYRD